MGNIGWILQNSTNDVNYKSHIPLLSDKELVYCLDHEDRISGRKQLLVEARKRKLPNVCRKCGCTENRACEGGCYWVEPGLCSQCVGKREKGNGR